MLFLKASLVLLLMAPTFVLTTCPDFTFRCPSGESFTVNTCWVWRRFQCETCESIESYIRERCPQYSCNGSVDSWYGHNNGSSAGAVSRVMTKVFRSACAIHDICYDTPDRSQEQCDDDFKYNMQTTCRFPGIKSVGIGVCYAAAGIAYNVVQRLEGIFTDFNNTCSRV